MKDYLALSASLLLLPPLLLEDVELPALLELQDRAADRSPERRICKKENGCLVLNLESISEKQIRWGMGKGMTGL